MIQCFKSSEKLRSVECDKKAEDYFKYYFDVDLVKSEIMNPFKNIRDPEKQIENKEMFYNLLGQTPETLKRYMIFTVKVIGVTKMFLNVVISENGLFGYIRLHHDFAKEPERGDYIKALILGFPFDEKKYQRQTDREKYQKQEQQLLKVEMGLKFPHKSNNEDSNHDCFAVCFPAIVKELHPMIDL